MKKIGLCLSLVVLLFAGNGCKKCATCTYSDNVNGKDTSDFCGRGNSYKDLLYQHEKNGWKCIEE